MLLNIFIVNSTEHEFYFLLIKVKIPTSITRAVQIWMQVVS